MKNGGDREQRDGEKRPTDGKLLPYYAVLVGLFNVSLASFLCARKDGRLPEPVAPSDLLLLGLAAQKISRVLTRSRVTSPLRAPFTEYEGAAGAGEVEEHAKGSGLRKVIGELLTCPYCLGTWIASGLVCGFAVRPKVIRMVASIFAVSSVADFAQQGYARVKDLNQEESAGEEAPAETSFRAG